MLNDHPIFVVMAVAVLAPLLAEIPIGVLIGAALLSLLLYPTLTGVLLSRTAPSDQILSVPPLLKEET